MMTSDTTRPPRPVNEDAMADQPKDDQGGRPPRPQADSTMADREKDQTGNVRPLTLEERVFALEQQVQQLMSERQA